MMNAKKLLLLLVTVGILVSTYFLFFHSGLNGGKPGPGETQQIDEPDELGGSLEAGKRVGGQKAVSSGQDGRKQSAVPGSPLGSRKTGLGGASLALKLFLEGKPLAGAKILLRMVPGGRERKETTDREGRVRFSGLAAGRYLVLSRDERVPKSYRIGPYKLKENQAKDLGRINVPPSAALKFRLLHPDGRPMSAREVRLFHAGEFGFRGVGLKEKTDAKGRGSFFGLSDGDWTLSVATKEYPLFEKNISLFAGDRLDLGDLRLQMGFNLLGRVVDDQGVGIPGASLQLAQNREGRGLKIEAFNSWSSVRSDKAGRFRFVIQNKEGRVRAEKDGFSSKTVNYRLDDGELRIVLQRTKGISGRVLGAIPGKTQVYAHRTDPRFSGGGGMGGEWMVVSVGPNGNFQFENLHPGSYGILAFSKGKGASLERQVKLLPGTSQRVDLVLKQGPSLSVSVVSKTGKPIPRAKVSLYYQSPQASSEAEWEKDMVAYILSSYDTPRVETKAGKGAKALFKGLWVGRALLILKAKGFSVTTLYPVVLKPGSQSLRVEMDGAARVVGKAFGSDGLPLVGAQVALDKVKGPGKAMIRFEYHSEGAVLSQQTVQADGSFHIEDVKPGNYLISLKPPLRKSGALFFDGSQASLDEKTLTLRSGDEAKITLRAKPMWTIKGRVLFQGEAVSGATVSMKLKNPSRGFSFPKTKKTDRKGNFRFEWVGKGQYDFKAAPPEKGVRTPKRSLDLGAGGGVRNLDLELGGGLVRGRIAFEGDPPKGLELRLVPKDEINAGTKQMVMIRVVSSNDHQKGKQEQTIIMGDGPVPLIPKEDGSFAFHFVTAGEWVLQIRAGQGQGKTLLKSLSLSLAKNQGLDLGDISLEKTFPVQLIVKDESGKLLEMASVKIFPIRDGIAEETPVFRGMIQKGKAKVPGLRVGSYKLVVRRVSMNSPKPLPPQEGRLEVLPGGKIRGSELQIR
jgi:protocatechuate 3,4-dioxygenase beta subunit